MRQKCKQRFAFPSFKIMDLTDSIIMAKIPISHISRFLNGKFSFVRIISALVPLFSPTGGWTLFVVLTRGLEAGLINIIFFIIYSSLEINN